MAAVEMEMRDGVDRETIETVQAMSGKLQVWLGNRHRDGLCAEGGVGRDRPADLGKNNEPDWLLDWRLAAYRRWLQMEEPRWAMLNYPEIDYQDQYYYAKPKSMAEKAQVAGRGGPQAAGHLRKAWHPA
jgi:Fe-S cluster assembly protein SufB